MIFKFRDYKIRFFNLRLILYVAILCFMGVQFVRSALIATNDSSSMIKQLAGIGMGVVVMIIFSLIDYHFITKMAAPIYIFTVLILLVVKFFGATYNNATRWIEIPGTSISIQPSEFCKITLIIVIAAFLANAYKNEKVSKVKTIALILLILIIPMFLILRQPDLSTTLVIIAIFAFMIFAAGLSYKWIVPILAGVGAMIAGVMVYALAIVDPNNVSSYQLRRIIAWQKPDLFPGIVYQQQNSIMAIGNGGLNGIGLFNTGLESVKTGNFLSEQDTDFIFAVIGEEVGFIGSCAIIALILLLVLDCLYMAYRAKDMTGRLLCIGYAGLISFQAFVNIGVATGLLPNTGLPLPFISAGLSSMLSLFIGLGIVLNVGLQRELSKARPGRFDR